MDFYPRKAQYLTGEEVWLCLEAADACEAQRYDRVVLVVYWLEAKIRTMEIVPARRRLGGQGGGRAADGGLLGAACRTSLPFALGVSRRR